MQTGTQTWHDTCKMDAILEEFRPGSGRRRKHVRQNRLQVYVAEGLIHFFYEATLFQLISQWPYNSI